MNSITGRVHSIETMGTLDGPGIRYVVFMQGCPLRCLYCHNRDTWEVNAGQELTARKIVNNMKRYIEFIKFSNGGITISGGEPTLQAEFVTEVFKQCKESGIHTALDTSGFVDIEKVEELLKYTDLVLLDIKHALKEKHKKITGVDNDKIAKFRNYVSDKGIDIWIRYVLVPGYTDGEKDLMAAHEIIKGLKSVKKIEVLPYHTMGKFKWEEISGKYPLDGVKEPTPEEVQRAQRILQSGI